MQSVQLPEFHFRLAAESERERMYMYVLGGGVSVFGGSAGLGLVSTLPLLFSAGSVPLLPSPALYLFPPLLLSSSSSITHLSACLPAAGGAHRGGLLGSLPLQCQSQPPRGELVKNARRALALLAGYFLFRVFIRRSAFACLFLAPSLFFSDDSPGCTFFFFFLFLFLFTC